METLFTSSCIILSGGTQLETWYQIGTLSSSHNNINNNITNSHGAVVEVVVAEEVVEVDAPSKNRVAVDPQPLE